MKVEVLDIKPPKLSFRAARQMFPFSVIPGGVFDARELADSIAKDVVVRDHYRDLQPDRMWFTRVKKPMLAYVSYRKDSKVGWTAIRSPSRPMNSCLPTASISSVPAVETASKSRSRNLCLPP